MCLGVTYLIAKLFWSVEAYLCGYQVLVERCMARSDCATESYWFGLRAFFCIERHCFSKGISPFRDQGWSEAKVSIVRQVVWAYFAKPFYTLNSTA